MDRLTRLKKTKNPGRYRAGGNYTSDYKACEVYDRLASYENTGLTPEEITNMRVKHDQATAMLRAWSLRTAAQERQINII